MSFPNPLDGGVLVGAETTYGTEASTKVEQITGGATLGVRRAVSHPRGRLSHFATAGRQLASKVDGEVTCGYSKADAIVGVVLGALATGAAGSGIKTYSIGLTAPENDSLTVAVNHGGGHEYTYTGCVPSSFRLDLSQEDCEFTLGLMGVTGTKEATATTLSPPGESNLVVPSEYGTLTIDSVEYDYDSISIDVSIPARFVGENNIGASTVRRACWTGPFAISATINLDFDDDSGADMDTVTMMNTYLTDGNFTTLTLNDGTRNWITLGDCRATGDHPALQAGDTSFALNVECSSLIMITTTA